jgi:putative NADH-flavin reductase
MPVIVVGADCPLGVEIVAALLPNAAEVRAFVTDASAAPSLKERGVKVAVGDVSDGSHVGGAALNTFCAVLLPGAAVDERERSFAANPAEVIAAWADGLRDAGTRRIIWVDDGSTDPGPLRAVAAEFVSVAGAGRSTAETVAEIVELEGAATLDGAT